MTLGGGEPWGVAIATSALAKRFSPTNLSEGWERAETMRVFAGMLALAVAAHHNLSRRIDAVAPPTASK